MSAVRTMLTWPSSACTVFRSLPAASDNVAAPCRRSWNRTGGNPDLVTNRLNAGSSRMRMGSTGARVTYRTASRTRGHSEDVQTIPGVSRIAHCHDDQDIPFSLYEPAT